MKEVCQESAQGCDRTGKNLQIVQSAKVSFVHHFSP